MNELAKIPYLSGSTNIHDISYITLNVILADKYQANVQFSAPNEEKGM